MGNYHSLTNTSFAQWQSLINDCMCYTAMRAKRWQNVFLVTFISADGFNACLSVSLSRLLKQLSPQCCYSVEKCEGHFIILLSPLSLCRKLTGRANTHTDYDKAGCAVGK